MKKKNEVAGLLFVRILFCLITIVLIDASCGRNDRSAEEDELINKGRPVNYQENDTISITPIPENLQLWINYYQQYDSAIKNRNFRASGVTVHMDSLEDATTGDLSLMENFFPLFSYSPDSSQIIDFWSYNQLIEINKSGERVIIGGDPDQEVVWINKRTGSKKQLMYNGPQQIVETADWINDQALILGMININDSSTSWYPEILLFNFTDTTFTNFRLGKNLPTDKLTLPGADFTNFWLKRKNYKRG